MPSLDQKMELLQQVGVHLFQNNASEMTQHESLRLLETLLKDIGGSMAPVELLHFIEERSGILSEKSPGVYAFSHLTLQEYFAALGLTRSSRGMITLLDCFRRSQAEEVVLLYAGLLESADPL